MSKPRVSYSEVFVKKEAVNPFKPMTISWLIHRYADEMDRTDRPLGVSHRKTLLKLSRSWVGDLTAAELNHQHIKKYCRERPDICAATRGQYVTYLSGVLKYAGAAWEDCEGVTDAAIAAAKPFLKKHGFIGKSTPRDRRPLPEEQAQLLALFEAQNKRPKNDIDMHLIARWQIASSRRIGETCKLLWGDWNKDDHTILVRKMKDPKKKNKMKIVGLPTEAQAILVEIEPLRKAPGSPDERIFPYNSHSISARYTEAKKLLGIANLRLHDSRREACSRFVEQGFTPSEAIGYSGHETTAVFERTYCRPDVARLKDGPASRRDARS